MKRLFIFFLILLALTVGFLAFKRLNKTSDAEGIVLYGNVDIRQVDLGFRVSGRVLTMLFQEGNLVKEGELMGVLDKQPYEDQVKQAQAHIESVKANLANAITTVKRRENLIGSGGISQQDIDDATSSRNILAANLQEAQAELGVAQTHLEDTELYAPADGTILTRIREPGTVVREADPIYTLSLLSPVWVRAYVSEKQLGLIYPNMPAEVYTDTPGSHPYQGHIGFISPVAEFTPKTVETTQLRTDLVYRLRVIVDNPDYGLRQGMPVTVRLLFKPPVAQTSETK